MMNQEENRNSVSIYEDAEGVLYLQIGYLNVDTTFVAGAESIEIDGQITSQVTIYEGEPLYPRTDFTTEPVALGVLGLGDTVTIEPYLPFGNPASDPYNPENKGKVIIKFEKVKEPKPV